MRRWLAVVMVAVAAAAGGLGCGGEAPRPPRALPADLVPATLPDPTDPANPYQLLEFAPARDRFAAAGPRSLVDEGRLYEIRRGGNLAGTLEVAALARRVDLRDEATRKELIGLLLPGATTTVTVRGTPVVRSVSEEKSTFLILGDGLFELVDVRRTEKVDPNQVLAALLDAQRPSGHLRLTTDSTRRRPL